MSQERIEEVIVKLDSLLHAITSSKPVLNLRESAVYTGLSESYLYKLTSSQSIPHFKPRGKIIYFKRSELDDWMLQNKVYSADELEEQVDNHLVGVAK